MTITTACTRRENLFRSSGFGESAGLSWIGVLYAHGAAFLPVHLIAASPGSPALTTHPTAEHQRLADCLARRADWKRWGPYVAERAWGTVREDYSATGDPWSYFPHDHARSRAYRWNEDGLGGFCNRFQNVCMGLALWNERDPFSRSGSSASPDHEGNHGEDVKEYYFYLDATPTHSYMKMLYKYPQVEYPYAQLVEESRRRSRQDRNSSCSTRSAMPFARAGTSTSSSSTPGPTRKTSSAGSRRSTAEPSSRPCTSCRTSGFAIPGPGGIPMIGPSYKRSASHRSG